MSLSLFEIYGIVCAVVFGATGVWRLVDAFRNLETDVFDVVYGMFAMLAAVVAAGCFAVNEPTYLVGLVCLMPFLGIIGFRIRIESDSFRDQYRKFIELGLGLVTFANLAIRATEMDDQWWISLVLLMFPVWALHSLITKAEREQAEFQASSKKRDGEALDRTGQEPEHDADTV